MGELFFTFFVIPFGSIILLIGLWISVDEYLFKRKRKKIAEKTVRTERIEVPGVVTSKVIKRTDYGYDYKISVRLETGNVVSFKGEYDYNKAREGEIVKVNYVTEYDKNDRILEDICYLSVN